MKTCPKCGTEQGRLTASGVLFHCYTLVERGESWQSTQCKIIADLRAKLATLANAAEPFALDPRAEGPGGVPWEDVPGIEVAAPPGRVCDGIALHEALMEVRG